MNIQSFGNFMLPRLIKMFWSFGVSECPRLYA